ncbi:hypothetical protein NKJ09_22730 [Mesorhizobium sp. M0189]|uniref:hypothetical protein n=1 Tax=Mesorhizobium sp. M0189 TaxID=2956909 RepID=UPI003339F386
MDDNDDENTMAGNAPAVVRRRYVRRTPIVPVQAVPVEAVDVIPVQPKKPARDTSNDFGNWEYRPWKGLPHWVHKPSGRSTFDRSEAKKLKRL